MKQQNYILYTMVFLLGLIFSSCQKEENIDFTLHKWKVIKIKKDGDSQFTYAKEDYIVDFISDSAFTINLDVNSCRGKYELLSVSSLKFTPALCSYACCDSQIAVDIINTFPEMTTYYVEGDELKFEGVGKIVLKKYS